MQCTRPEASNRLGARVPVSFWLQVARNVSNSRANSSRRLVNCAFDSRIVSSARKSSVAPDATCSERYTIRLWHAVIHSLRTYLQRAGRSLLGTPRAAARRSGGTRRLTWRSAPCAHRPHRVTRRRNSRGALHKQRQVEWSKVEWREAL